MFIFNYFYTGEQGEEQVYGVDDPNFGLLEDIWITFLRIKYSFCDTWVVVGVNDFEHVKTGRIGRAIADVKMFYYAFIFHTLYFNVLSLL